MKCNAVPVDMDRRQIRGWLAFEGVVNQVRMITGVTDRDARTMLEKWGNGGGRIGELLDALKRGEPAEKFL